MLKQKIYVSLLSVGLLGTLMIIWTILRNKLLTKNKIYPMVFCLALIDLVNISVDLAARISFVTNTSTDLITPGTFLSAFSGSILMHSFISDYLCLTAITVIQAIGISNHSIWLKNNLSWRVFGAILILIWTIPFSVSLFASPSFEWNRFVFMTENGKLEPPKLGDRFIPAIVGLILTLCLSTYLICDIIIIREIYITRNSVCSSREDKFQEMKRLSIQFAITNVVYFISPFLALFMLLTERRPDLAPFLCVVAQLGIFLIQGNNFYIYLICNKTFREQVKASFSRRSPEYIYVPEFRLRPSTWAGTNALRLCPS